jgi:hypothetical protein
MKKNFTQSVATLLQHLVEMRPAMSLLFVIAMLGFASFNAQAAVPIVTTVDVILNADGTSVTVFGAVSTPNGVIEAFGIQYCKKGTALWTQSLATSGPSTNFSVVPPLGSLDYTYEVRAVAKNSSGWGYGAIKEVTLPATITFIANGGSTPPKQIVAIGDKITEPTAPTRPGHTFGGWY